MDRTVPLVLDKSSPVLSRTLPHPEQHNFWYLFTGLFSGNYWH